MQREDERFVYVLAKRIGGDELEGTGDDVGVAAEAQIDTQPGLERLPAHLLQ
jgi:hypothetical protein